MHYQNRVLPDGSLVNIAARGQWLGNRGGRFHKSNRQLNSRHFANKQWIYCVLEFKNRSREVFGKGYTELFFCDEASAFAAGHRPCFECQREKATLFAKLWQKVYSLSAFPKVAEIDHKLHEERLAPPTPLVGNLQNGVMIKDEFGFAIHHQGRFLHWAYETGASYERTLAVCPLLLTPPSMVKLLQAGFTIQYATSTRR